MVFVWQVGITAVISITVVFYLRGRRRQQTTTRMPLILFLAGLTLLAVALVSPLHQLAGQYFFARVTQHLLLIAWIPSLILSSNPLPTLQQGLPASWQSRWEVRPSLHPKIQQTIHIMTAPGAALLLFASVFWLWYDPVLHALSVQYAWIRPFEIFTLLSAAGLYWWHITGAAPHHHQPMPWVIRIIYVLIGVIIIKLVGLIVMFSETIIFLYPAPFHMPGLDIDGQRLGGMIFWIIGGSVFITTAIVLFSRWLAEEENKPSLPESTWASEEAMRAPGWEK